MLRPFAFIALALLASLVHAAEPDLDQRRQAAASTADKHPYCKAIQPFFWEIGDHTGRLASASVGGPDSPGPATVMPIASASKWLFGAYAVQRRQGKPTDEDIKALTMRSGYTGMSYMSCVRLLPRRRAEETVQQCLAEKDNDQYSATHDGRFYYNGGHFQALASKALGLGDDNNARLAADMITVLGPDLSISFGSPQLAGGMQTSAADYSLFLRKLLNQQLLLGGMLGSHAVCTNPKTCTTADFSPVPDTESWHYSLAHWVEDDPVTGDGAFSSPGAFGFYPWIDASRQYYGVLARHSREPRAYYQSVQCGRLIRRAWLSGVAQ